MCNEYATEGMREMEARRIFNQRANCPVFPTLLAVLYRHDRISLLSIFWQVKCAMRFKLAVFVIFRGLYYSSVLHRLRKLIIQKRVVWLILVGRPKSE